jgi:proliferating cell nuclear antigen
MPLLFEIRTVQASAFRVLIESLKDILTDVNIEVRRKEVVKKNSGNEAKDDEDNKAVKRSKGGLRIMAMNSKKTVLIHLKLDAENFETFNCERKKILIGINMLHFFKLIKTIDSSSVLTLFMDSDETGRLGIKIENAEKKQISTYKLSLMDLDSDPLDVPPTSFDAVITMPSSDFHKLCRDMNHISEYIEIQSVSKSLILKGRGDIAHQETILGETPNGVSINRSESNNTIVQGKYELKHLVMFTKCTSLCPSIDIYMKNEYPLVIHYQVASLGDIYLCLTPVIDEAGMQ